MTNEDYKLTQEQIMMLGKLVQSLKLKEFIETINVAEAVAPIMDPTMYREAGNNLGSIKNMACSLRRFQVTVEGIKNANIHGS